MNSRLNELDLLKTVDRDHVWHHLTPGAAASNGLPMFVREPLGQRGQ